METHDVVIKCFNECAEANRVLPFRKEEELQWYLSLLLAQRTGMEIHREVRTPCLYYTDKKTRLLKKANGPVKGERHRRGYIDIVCFGEMERWAIEVKYPRGEDQDQFYGANIRRDLTKLTDMESVSKRYLLCLIKEDNLEQYLRELRKCSNDDFEKSILTYVVGY